MRDLREPASSSLENLKLKYRDVEYMVVQGIEQRLWKWSLSFDGKFLRGEAQTKAEATAEAERAIEQR